MILHNLTYLISCLLLISLSKSCQAKPPRLQVHWLPSNVTGRRDARRLKQRKGKFQGSASPSRSPSKANTSNRHQHRQCMDADASNTQFFSHSPSPSSASLYSPSSVLFSGSAASSSLSSWSTVCSSAVPQARQPRYSPLHRLFRLPHTRAGAPHFPSGLLPHLGQKAHTLTPPCYDEQPRDTNRRTRLFCRRLSHNPCSRHPARLYHKPRNLHLRNLLVPASRMLSAQVSRLQQIR